MKNLTKSLKSMVYRYYVEYLFLHTPLPFSRKAHLSPSQKKYKKSQKKLKINGLPLLC